MHGTRTRNVNLDLRLRKRSVMVDSRGIQSGDTTWVNFVPRTAAALIERDGFFGLRLYRTALGVAISSVVFVLSSDATAHIVQTRRPRL
jgi:hypothetical protein